MKKIKKISKDLPWVSHQILNLKSVKVLLIFLKQNFKSRQVWQILNLKFGEKLTVSVNLNIMHKSSIIIMDRFLKRFYDFFLLNICFVMWKYHLNFCSRENMHFNWRQFYFCFPFWYQICKYRRTGVILDNGVILDTFYFIFILN